MHIMEHICENGSLKYTISTHNFKCPDNYYACCIICGGSTLVNSEKLEIAPNLLQKKKKAASNHFFKGVCPDCYSDVVADSFFTKEGYEKYQDYRRKSLFEYDNRFVKPLYKLIIDLKVASIKEYEKFIDSKLRLYAKSSLPKKEILYREFLPKNHSTQMMESLDGCYQRLLDLFRTSRIITPDLDKLLSKFSTMLSDKYHLRMNWVESLEEEADSLRRSYREFGNALVKYRLPFLYNGLEINDYNYEGFHPLSYFEVKLVKDETIQDRIKLIEEMSPYYS